jgi:type I restriction enzyme S subunit
MAIAPDDPKTSRTTFQKSVAILKPKRDLIDPRFLYYLLRFDNARLSDFAAGTTQKNLLLKDFRSFSVRVPPLVEQKAIVAVLGALDDKIELNRRMNATLEAMARALFQSWFVDFDPVRAKLDGRQPTGLDPATAALFPNEFEHSELGPIPKGWEVGRLGQYLETQIGGDWGEDAPFHGSVEIVALRGVDLEHLRKRGAADPPHRWITESSLEKRRMCERDILVASSGVGPCGRPLWASPSIEVAFGIPVLYSNFCKRYRAASSAHALYLDRVLFGMRESGEIWQFINGTSLPNLDSNGLLKGKSVLLPPVDILELFSAFVRPLYVHLYSSDSRILPMIRDTLLPKLLSGEVEAHPIYE